MRNGERGVIEVVDLRAGSLSVRIDDHIVELDAKFLASRPHGGRPTLEQGYAMTVTPPRA